MNKRIREILENIQQARVPRKDLSLAEKRRLAELNNQVSNRMTTLQSKLANLKKMGNGVQQTQQFLGGLRKPQTQPAPRVKEIQGRAIFGKQQPKTTEPSLKDVRLAELQSHFGLKPKPPSPQIKRRQEARANPQPQVIQQPQMPVAGQRGVMMPVGQRRRKSDENITPKTSTWEEVEAEITGPSNSFKVGGGSFISTPPPPEVLAGYPDPNTITPEDFAGMHKQEDEDEPGFE